jgi:hypothetical protein
VAKGQTRWTGFDDKTISMYARGMTTREIQGHLEEMYGIEPSRGAGRSSSLWHICHPRAGLSAFERAAAGLIEAGLAFIESMAVSAGNSQSAHHGDTQHPLSGLFSRDPRTNHRILSIPLPASVTEERLAAAVTGFLRGLRT